MGRIKIVFRGALFVLTALGFAFAIFFIIAIVLDKMNMQAGWQLGSALFISILLGGYLAILLWKRKFFKEAIQAMLLKCKNLFLELLEKEDVKKFKRFSSELLKKEYIKKFIFFASLIIFAAIVFRIAIPKEINVRIVQDVPVRLTDDVGISGTVTTEVSGLVDTRISGDVDANVKSSIIDPVYIESTGR